MFLSTAEALHFQISDSVICNSCSKKLLGTTFHKKLIFEKHINTFCQRADRNTNVLAGLIHYMDCKIGAC